MTRAELKSAAKEQIKGKIGILFVMFLIIFAIAFVCAFIPLIGGIASFIITPSFSLSLCMVYLKLTKKEEISVGNVFDGFNNTGRALWLNIIVSFFTFLWTLLLIIPGIIKQYAYSMSFYILADNPELTAREALSKSKEMMNGHKLTALIPWRMIISQSLFPWSYWESGFWHCCTGRLRQRQASGFHRPSLMSSSQLAQTIFILRLKAMGTSFW